MLECIGISLIISFLFINLLRFCSGVITWLMIFAIIVLGGLSGVLILVNTDPSYFGSGI